VAATVPELLPFVAVLKQTKGRPGGGAPPPFAARILQTLLA
jgi:hypothetical protein